MSLDLNFSYMKIGQRQCLCTVAFLEALFWRSFFGVEVSSSLVVLCCCESDNFDGSLFSFSFLLFFGCVHP
jgi:hypothetical protein